jgi:hypothetical protein
MNEEGQIIHDDFCFTLTEAKAGALVCIFFSKTNVESKSFE